MNEFYSEQYLSNSLEQFLHRKREKNFLLHPNWLANISRYAMYKILPQQSNCLTLRLETNDIINNDSIEVSKK